MLRKLATILAVAICALATLLPAVAQAPAPVPALPDTERRTAYSITAATGPYDVGWAVYGDGVDYGNWIEVWLDGVRLTPITQWTLGLASGSLTTSARPLTNARVTLITASTGTLQIVGARRPRRLAQFAENRGVAARDLNQALSDIISQSRENWDKTNDVTGRVILAPPGETMNMLPRAALRPGVLAFDNSGQPVIQPNVPAGSIPANSITNALLAQMAANTLKCNNTGATATPTDCTLAALGIPTVGGTNTFTGANTFSGAHTLSGTNTLSGTSTFTGSAYFASGRPWCDVRSQGALGDNSNNDATAINACLTIVTAFGGGIVYFPPGNYRVTSTITIATAAKLVGAGYNTSNITASGDFTVLAFGASSAHSSLDGLWVVGYQNAAATADAVTVATNMPIYFSNCRIWGGNFALNTAGIDGSVFNCFICGAGTSGGCINSTGANWYDRVKADTIGFTVAVGYQQGTNAAIMENTWVNSDFSGSFSAASVRIQDTNNLATTAFSNSIFSNALTITGAKHTLFGTNRFGVAVASSASLSAVGNFGYSALTFTGAGARSCAGNTAITC